MHICFQKVHICNTKIVYLEYIANLEILRYGWHFSEVMSFTSIIKDVDGLYTDPKRKLYIVFKSIYFDDKLNFGVNFFRHRIFNALSMSLKKISDENHKLHNFYE